MKSAAAIGRNERFARCISTSKRVRWDIDEDVIKNRSLESGHKFLPDGLSRVDRFAFLSPSEQRFLSQIQGRTYANVLGMIERFINAKVLELSSDHWLGDQTALEALIRFSDDELKHQELFRRIEILAGAQMPPGYRFLPDPNDVARSMLSKSSWAAMALTLHIELLTQLHYRESVAPDHELSDLFKDVLLFHWKEESQHAIVDELEWQRLDADLSDEARGQAVEEFIELLLALDGILQAQASEDVRYLAETTGRDFSAGELLALETGVLGAYRWQYILSGIHHPQFVDVLTGLVTVGQAARIQGAIAGLM